MNEEKQGVTQWAFYALCVKIGVVLVIGGGLFLLARRGDAAAIAVLAAMGTLVLAGVGFGAALLILDRQTAAEQKRFTDNAKENMLFLEQQARVQNLQMQGMGRTSQTLLQQNERLSRLLPGPGVRDVDLLSWDVREDSEAERGW